MAFTADDVARLEKAISRGVLRVQFSDRLVQYDSLKAMRDARREMLSEIATAAGNRPRRVIRLTQRGTGL
jgi:hypothetical protein